MFTGERQRKTYTQRYCAHAGSEVRIETTVVYPADILPESPPRIVKRTCTHFTDCNLQDKAACTMAVTIPGTRMPNPYV